MTSCITKGNCQCQIVYDYFSYLLFLLFPYCIVGPTNMYIYIYPSPMCIINSFSITKIRDSPFSLFSHGIRAQGEKKPNYFRFIRESILGNLSVTVFHSGHLSHLLKLSDQPSRRQKTLTVVRKPSPPRLFPATSFFDTDHTIRCVRRRSSSFVKALEGDSHPRASHACFFFGGLNLTRR